MQKAEKKSLYDGSFACKMEKAEAHMKKKSTKCTSERN
jgi:hypothetical protein